VAIRVLLVEPSAYTTAILRRSLPFGVVVDTCSQFAAARDCLRVHNYQLLVTNLRLGAFNGIHLVHLARTKPAGAGAAIVYTETREPTLGREVQRSGAFYEVSDRLVAALPMYLKAVLPPADRRDPRTADRRRVLRGGRRASDVIVANG
jgi:CheY-like chemotaxis protein